MLRFAASGEEDATTDEAGENESADDDRDNGEAFAFSDGSVFCDLGEDWSELVRLCFNDFLDRLFLAVCRSGGHRHLQFAVVQVAAAIGGHGRIRSAEKLRE